MGASFHRGNSLGFMQMMGGTDMDQIQLFLGKHILPIGIKMLSCNPKFTAHQLSAFLR
jgi:hypothetical protein